MAIPELGDSTSIHFRQAMMNPYKLYVVAAVVLILALVCILELLSARKARRQRQAPHMLFQSMSDHRYWRAAAERHEAATQARAKLRANTLPAIEKGERL